MNIIEDQAERMARREILKELAESVAVYSEELEKMRVPAGRLGYLVSQFQGTLYEMLAFTARQQAKEVDDPKDAPATTKN